MIIDVNELLRRKAAKKELHLIFQDEGFDNEGEIIGFSEPIKLDGCLNMIGDILIFDGMIHTALNLECSRCLDRFNYTVDIEIHEEFSNNPENKDDEFIFINSDTIDITEIIHNNVILSLPIKKLCRKDCKGLCQHCGTNLNFSTCDCGKDNVDPRLSKLKDLFLSD